MTPEATNRKPVTDAMAIPTTSSSDTYSSQCSPLYHQFSPTRHLQHINTHSVEILEIPNKNTLISLITGSHKKDLSHNHIFQWSKYVQYTNTQHGNTLIHTCRWLLDPEQCHTCHDYGKNAAEFHICSGRASHQRWRTPGYTHTLSHWTSGSLYTPQTHYMPHTWVCLVA